MAGIGLQGAGGTSSGFGAPDESSEPGGVVLRNDKTGDRLGGRKIGPSTGDYEVDEYGRLLGMSNVQQNVLLAVMNAGPALQSIDRLSDSFERQATAILTTAMSVLIANGQVEIVGVQSVRLGVRGGLQQGQALYALAWRDLTTNTEQRTAI